MKTLFTFSDLGPLCHKFISNLEDYLSSEGGTVGKTSSSFGLDSKALDSVDEPEDGDPDYEAAKSEFFGSLFNTSEEAELRRKRIERETKEGTETVVGDAKS